MSDTLKIFGTTYTGVTAAKFSDGNSNTLVYIPESEGGGGGITVIDTVDSHGGTIREFTAQELFHSQTITSSGAVSQTLQPDIFYYFTSNAITSLTITLASNTGQYHFSFISPATAVNLILPVSVIMPSSFEVEANSKYEIDILDGYGVYAEWTYAEASS